ncbi:MAG: tripartite tricarboxylate transporter TctB family protein [Rubrobacteraceae bacterium]
MYRLGGVIPLLLGIFGVVYSYTLGFGSPAQPGPGFWPFIASLAIVGASIALLITERSGEQYEPLTARAWFVGYGVISIVAFILLFQLLGFIIPALLLFAFWLRFLGGESWGMTALLSVFFTAGFYILFDQLLGVPFPQDVVEGLWE